jgi:hypothetical protein
MKLWTMLAGLAVAGILASSAYAQDAPKKQGKKGRFTPMTWADFKLDDGAPLDMETYVKTALARLPESVDKDQAKPRIEGRFVNMAKAISSKTDDDEAKAVKIKKDEYEKYVKDMQSKRGKGKKKAATTT